LRAVLEPDDPDQPCRRGAALCLLARTTPEPIPLLEQAVTMLAARGHGNRAIAERLYVTPRTVETHLTHAFAKLDISSRAELAAALQPAPADSGTLTVI
jgi:DNA-binding NarL/FixJ family response regulator